MLASHSLPLPPLSSRFPSDPPYKPRKTNPHHHHHPNIIGIVIITIGIPTAIDTSHGMSNPTSPPPLAPASPWLASLPDINPEDTPPTTSSPPFMTFTCGTCERTIGDSTSITCAIRQSHSFALDKMVGITLGEYATSATSKPEAAHSPAAFDYHCLYRPILCGKCGSTLGKNYKSAPMGLDHLCEKFAVARDAIGVYYLNGDLPALRPGESEEILRQIHPEPNELEHRVERLMWLVVYLKEGQDELFEKMGTERESGGGGVVATGGKFYQELATRVEELEKEIQTFKNPPPKTESSPPPPLPTTIPHPAKPSRHPKPQSSRTITTKPKRKRTKSPGGNFARKSMDAHQRTIANSFNEEDGDDPANNPNVITLADTSNDDSATGEDPDPDHSTGSSAESEYGRDKLRASTKKRRVHPAPPTVVLPAPPNHRQKDRPRGSLDRNAIVTSYLHGNTRNVDQRVIGGGGGSKRTSMSMQDTVIPDSQVPSSRAKSRR
ncbi:hypothetical protein DFH27DRAFT_252485 [Peziza echinospora]|nr:hypothetical protein DFH27DRAFT_252485 [Peziza echinospora]